LPENLTAIYLSLAHNPSQKHSVYTRGALMSWCEGLYLEGTAFFGEVMMKKVIFVLLLLLLGCRTTPAVTSVSVTPSTASVASAGTQILQATVVGTGNFDSKVNWTTTLGTLSATTGSSVTLNAPSVSSSTSITVTATSAADSSKFGSAVVTVNPPPPPTITGVALDATKVALRLGESTTISSVVSGTGAFHAGVTWTLENPVGSLSAATENNVVYTAPSSSPQGMVRVTATSLQNPTFKKTLYMSVNPVRNMTIAAGQEHSLALQSDGTLLAWGLDDFGQLGDDAVLDNKGLPMPVDTTLANNIVAIAAGSRHSLALKSDGTLLAWGRDTAGQLGIGGIPNSASKQATPVVVTGANDIVAIAAGGSHSLALKSDGTLLAWGYNDKCVGDVVQIALEGQPVAVRGSV
jgi:hypothetical protein